MLTLQQLYFPLISFQFFTKIGLLPLVIDARTGHITRQTSNKIWYWWYFLLVLSASLHGGLAIGQFITFLTISGDKPLQDVPLVINLLIFLAALYLFPSAFVWHSDVTIMTFDSLFQGNTFVSRHIVALTNFSILLWA